VRGAEKSGERSVKFFDRLQPVALLVLRVALAIIFIFHGYPKLTHTHGDLQKMFVEHGMPAYFSLLAGVIETFCGGLLAIGLLARPAALLLALEMSVAIWKVHSVHGIYSVRDYEFPLALATACFVLASVGAGLISVDHFVFEGGGGGRKGGGSYKPPKIKYKGQKRDRNYDD
jgi:putative oxidoreductase